MLYVIGGGKHNVDVSELPHWFVCPASALFGLQLALYGGNLLCAIQLDVQIQLDAVYHEGETLGPSAGKLSISNWGERICCWQNTGGIQNSFPFALSFKVQKSFSTFSFIIFYCMCPSSIVEFNFCLITLSLYLFNNSFLGRQCQGEDKYVKLIPQ